MGEPKTKQEASIAIRDMEDRLELNEQRAYEAWSVHDYAHARMCVRRGDQFRDAADRLRALLPTLPD